jgi:hypothetical protein
MLTPWVVPAGPAALIYLFLSAIIVIGNVIVPSGIRISIVFAIKIIGVFPIHIMLCASAGIWIMQTCTVFVKAIVFRIVASAGFSAHAETSFTLISRVVYILPALPACLPIGSFIPLPT